jgi:hypothetical protein
MNSKQVLSKIAKMLNLTDEVTFTDAKTADGTILQSPTFDLGEKVEVVNADGTKTPAPDGEHQISLKDSEGNEVVIRVVTKDGIISERENVEEAQPETEPQPEGLEEAPTEIAMAKDNMEPAHALPNTTDEDPRNSLGDDTDETENPIISLTYRITELEKICAGLVEKIAEKKAEIADTKEADVKMEEVDVPKLDGAPVEMSINLSAIHKPTTNKVGNSQNSFLSKLYN